MSGRPVDRAWQAARESVPAPEVEAEALRRVRNRLDVGAGPSAAAGPGCKSAGTRAPRAPLTHAPAWGPLDPHADACAANGEDRPSLMPLMPEIRPRNRHRWPGAAAAVFCVLAGASLWLHRLQPAATVENVTGALVALQGNQFATAHPAMPLTAGETLATAADSNAELRLADGSALALDQQTSVTLERGLWSQTLRLAQGRIIVHAAKQHLGRHLYVDTGDCRVAVVGTIFAVTRLPQGTRVSVAQGVVAIQAAGEPGVRAVRAGEQYVSAAAVPRIAVAADMNLTAPGQIAFAPAAEPHMPTVPPLLHLASPATTTAPAAALPRPAAPASLPRAQALAPSQAPASPTPSVDTPEFRHYLFTQARQAIPAAPRRAEPGMYYQLAKFEAAAFPNDAIADYQTAFQSAVDLTVRGSDADRNGYWTSGAGMEVPQGSYEDNSVLGLVDLKAWGPALRLARSCDHPRANCYNEILPRLAAGARTDNEDLDATALAQECYRGDGSFPFVGALVYLKKNPETIPLVRAGYAAAGDAQITVATAVPEFLAEGHRVAPRLDAELENLIPPLLQQLGQIKPTLPNGGAIGSELIGLMRQIDPLRADELALQYPSFSTSPSRDALNRQFQQVQNAQYASAHPPLPDTAFVAQIDQARAAKDTAAAQSAADAALRMANAGTVASNPYRSIDLAQTLDEQQRIGDATRVLGLVFDALDAEGAAADLAYPSAKPVEQVLYPTFAEYPIAQTASEYGAAAIVDLQLAAQRALLVTSPLLRPMALVRVAGSKPAPSAAPTPPAAAAPAPQTFAFDAVSIRLAPPDTPSAGIRTDPGRLTATAMTLRGLVLAAYNLQPWQIAPPGNTWTDKERFTLQASTAVPVTREQALRLLQSVLADRFHLVLQHQSRPVTIYELVAGDGPVHVDGNRSGMDLFPLPTMPDGTGPAIVTFQLHTHTYGAAEPPSGLLSRLLEAKQATMADLALELERQLKLPLTDHTGIAGKHDFAFKFDADENAADPNVPPLRAALQEQLGLKLIGTKGPIDVYTILSAERPATDP